MSFKCRICGARYMEAEMRRSGRCDMRLDGGAICGGKLEPEAEVSVDAAREPDSTAVELVTKEATGEGTAVVRHSREALPEPFRALLSRMTMRRGTVYPQGEATAELEFKSINDRATFAALIDLAGGRLSG